MRLSLKRYIPILLITLFTTGLSPRDPLWNLLITPSGALTPVSPGLTDMVAYYSCDDVSEGLANSLGGAAATENANHPTYGVAGKKGTAITIGYRAQLLTSLQSRSSATWSISFWVKATTTAYNLMISADHSGNKGFGIQSWSGEVYAFNLAAAGGTSCYMPVGALDGDWHHIVATWNYGTVKIYRDGILRNTRSGPPMDTDYTDTFIAIGGRNNSYVGGSDNVMGSMDEISIRTNILTAANVLWEYNGGAGRSYSEY